MQVRKSDHHLMPPLLDAAAAAAISATASASGLAALKVNLLESILDCASASIRIRRRGWTPGEINLLSKHYLKVSATMKASARCILMLNKHILGRSTASPPP